MSPISLLCTNTEASLVRLTKSLLLSLLLTRLFHTLDAMIVSHFPHGPTAFFTLNNVSLRHDIATYGESTVSEQYPHLIFENFSSSLGFRIKDILRFLFPVPKEDAKRVMTFANDADFISFRCVPSWILGSRYPI